MGKTNNARFRPESAENLVHNSAFDFWQEGTSFPNAANGTYYSDLIQYGKNGAMVHTISRSVDVPANSIAKYSLDSTITTIDNAIAANEYALLGYQMEGNDLQKIKGKKFTLSFKVKATKAGIYCVAFRNSASNRSYVAEYTVNASNTWEYKEIVVQHDTSGTWNYNENLGMYITWALAMGTNFHAPAANSWQTGGYFSTANQVNSCDFLSNSFRITEIKVNAGVGAGEYNRAGKDLTEELFKVQRYFEKSYDLDVVPGTPGVYEGSYYQTPGSANVNSDATPVIYKSTKRAIPNFTIRATFTGNIGFGSLDGTNADVVLTSNHRGVGSASAYNQQNVGANQYISFHWVANARF